MMHVKLMWFLVEFDKLCVRISVSMIIKDRYL